MSSEADKLEKIFYHSSNNSCGFFSRVKQIPGLKSSEFENNIVTDKARFIFIKSFEEIFTNDTKILYISTAIFVLWIIWSAWGYFGG